jgi:hypothetical protein
VVPVAGVVVAIFAGALRPGSGAVPVPSDAEADAAQRPG